MSSTHTHTYTPRERYLVSAAFLGVRYPGILTCIGIVLKHNFGCNKTKEESDPEGLGTVRKLSADDETLRREISLRTHAFFQKPLPVVFPEHVTRGEREGEGGVVSQVVVEEHRTSCGIDGAKFSSHIRGLGIR
jgi:hypothetical protein